MGINFRRGKRRVNQAMDNRGVLTVEAALTFPLFMLGMLLLILLLRDLGQKDVIKMRLQDVSEQISHIGVNSSLELEALALAAVPFIDAGPKATLVPVYPKLYPDGSFKVTYLWTRELPVVGAKSQLISMSGRGLYLGSRGLENLKVKTVYITATGSKYHLKDCSYLAKSSFTIKEDEALKQKYSPCWICIGGLERFEKAPGGELSDGNR